jgi:hypothetical protein
MAGRGNRLTSSPGASSESLANGAARCDIRFHSNEQKTFGEFQMFADKYFVNSQ